LELSGASDKNPNSIYSREKQAVLNTYITSRFICTRENFDSPSVEYSRKFSKNFSKTIYFSISSQNFEFQVETFNKKIDGQP